MKVTEKSKNYAGNRAMNKIVHAEYRAFKRGNISTGVLLAGTSRAAGVANIIVGIPVTAVVAAGGVTCRGSIYCRCSCNSSSSCYKSSCRSFSLRDDSRNRNFYCRSSCCRSWNITPNTNSGS